MKIAVLTAGGAGMFCGSCMQDNAFVKALRIAGADAVLLPTYTPIRVDADSVSEERVFMGGLNVYLDSLVPGWHRLPRILTGWLNRPGILRLLTRLSSSTDASQLGRLTWNMLQGPDGPQHREVSELVDYLTTDLKPDVIIFSNALLAGILPALKTHYSGTILCLLQGDDIFLDALPGHWKGRILPLMEQRAAQFDGFLTHSSYYSRHMANYLSLPESRIQTIPLTLDFPEHDLEAATGPHQPSAAASRDVEPTVGYFARVCPEKGAAVFLEAAVLLAERRPNLKFLMGGYLPGLHQRWFNKHFRLAEEHTGPARLAYHGSPASAEAKLSLLQQMNILCCPSPYREPKGLSVLEAAAAGVASVVPEHGAFPERILDLKQGTVFPCRSGEPQPSDVADAVEAALDASTNSEALIQQVRQLHDPVRSGIAALQAVLELADQGAD